jgi:hypothetical protein
MSSLASGRFAEAGDILVCGLTPSGCIDVRRGLAEEGPPISAPAAKRILESFQTARGHGVLQLGAGELGRELHPTLSYWREIGQVFIARVCGTLDPTDPIHQDFVVPEVTAEEIEDFLQSAPPMRGGEFIAPDLISKPSSRIDCATASAGASSKP